jgi:DNA-binding CsgD family transcriptional regulator
MASTPPRTPSGRVPTRQHPGLASVGSPGARVPLDHDGRNVVSPPEPRGEGARTSSRNGPRSAARVLLPLSIFGGITALVAVDLLSDLQAGHSPLHLVLESAAGALALVGVALFARHAWVLHGVADELERDLRTSEAETGRWRAEARQAHEGSGAAIDREFAKWELTDAERGVALLLLKGLSHKEIASQRGTYAGTVRQQALAIYRKAGLSGRSSLAAFFLEGLVLPDAPESWKH